MYDGNEFGLVLEVLGKTIIVFVLFVAFSIAAPILWLS
tara:strand:+ start:170 stop:283 length:114 start_codon:yes stop_codon:yes gene_type:complete